MNLWKGKKNAENEKGEEEGTTEIRLAFNYVFVQFKKHQKALDFGMTLQIKNTQKQKH